MCTLGIWGWFGSVGGMEAPLASFAVLPPAVGMVPGEDYLPDDPRRSIESGSETAQGRKTT